MRMVARRGVSAAGDGRDRPALAGDDRDAVAVLVDPDAVALAAVAYSRNSAWKSSPGWRSHDICVRITTLVFPAGMRKQLWRTSEQPWLSVRTRLSMPRGS